VRSDSHPSLLEDAASGSALSRNSDLLFSRGTAVIAGGSIVLLVGLAVLLIHDSLPSLSRYGPNFFVTTKWDPVFEEFGAAHYAYGTLVTSILALILATPVGIATALFVAEYAPRWLGDPIGFVIELLAVIPSVIFGLWAFFILTPIVRFTIEPALKAAIGPLPVIGGLFVGPTIGRDYFTAGVILAIMILPTIMSISREIFRAVPDTQREGMLALGATRWEMISNAVLPYARGGLAGAMGLGLARAMGETMAVTMVIGNSSSAISASLLTPGYTMASAIANQFTEADKEIYFAAIVQVALMLLVVATIVNLLSRVLVARITSKFSDAA